MNLGRLAEIFTGKARPGAPVAGYSQRTKQITVVLLAFLLVVGLLQSFTPGPFRHFFVDFVLTHSLILGIAASSLIFLSAYGGMISLAQVLMYGLCGFVVGNSVTAGGSKGLNLGLNPWVGVLIGVVVTTLVGFVLGVISSRSSGLYYLMITLTYGVIGTYFFGQVTQLSGFGGINQVRVPGFIGEPDSPTNPERMFYATLVVAVLVYLLLRYVSRTPFGLTLQGVRDDPVRMNSLGYNVAMHRVWAFTLSAFVASLAGVLYVWEWRSISPTTINLFGIIDLLVIAVIGGILVLEGAWLGAFVFVALESYVRDVLLLNNWIPEDRFRTLVGAVVLVLVLACPEGLAGLRRVRFAIPTAVVGAVIWGTMGGLKLGSGGAISGIIVGAVAGIGFAGLVSFIRKLRWKALLPKLGKAALQMSRSNAD